MALCLPAVDTSRERLNGFEVLLMGWMGPFAAQFRWFANLTFFKIMDFTARESKFNSKYFASLGVIQSVLLFNALFWQDVYDDSGSRPITHYGFGYWLWLAIIAFTCIWPFVLKRLADPERRFTP
jgi:hypothetical protein